MNKTKNLKIVTLYGDNFQLEYGAEFGFFAINLTREDLNYFCEKLNKLK